MDYDTIARTLGFASRSGAWSAVDRCVRRRQRDLGDLAYNQMIVDTELLQARQWRSAMGGNLTAVRTCLRAIELRVRLGDRYGQDDAA